MKTLTGIIPLQEWEGHQKSTFHLVLKCILSKLAEGNTWSNLCISAVSVIAVCA